MKSITVAHKYAKALFVAAEEEGKLDRVAADMAGLGDLARARTQEGNFARFLVSPEVSTEEKIAFIRRVFGPRLDPMTVDFVILLLEKKRILVFPAAAEDFGRMIDEHRGLLKAQVITAIPLSGDQERRLKTRLDGLTGKNVILQKRVDAGVLGGVEVHLGNRILDGSLRQGLKRLRETLHRTEVN